MMILHAGNARSSAFEAIAAAKRGEADEAAAKLKEAAARGLDASIDAIPESRLKEQSNVDVILTGPQVRYLEGKIKSSVDVPVAVIDNMAYGMMKGDLVLDQALGLVNA